MIKNSIITLEHVILQSSGNIVSDMDGEKVMLNIEQGKYYNLGEVGGFIWVTLESPISVMKLIDTILSEYDIEQMECQNQVITFLEQLRSEGLIELVYEA